MRDLLPGLACSFRIFLSPLTLLWPFCVFFGCLFSLLFVARPARLVSTFVPTPQRDSGSRNNDRDSYVHTHAHTYIHTHAGDAELSTMPSAAVCVDNNSDFRITCVSVNVANTCAVVVASPPPQGVFVVTPLLLQSHIHSQRRAKTAAAATAAAAAAAASCASTSNASSGARPSNFCQSVGGAFSGRVERAVQLNSSSLFALTCADAEDRPKRLLRIVDSGARAGPAKASATSAGRPRRPPRVVAELQFSDDIVDVQWTRHNLVVVLPKAVNVFSSRTLAHRHRLPTRPCLHQQQRQSGGSGQHTPRDSVVRLCPFSPEGQHGGGHGNAPTSEQSSMWPWVKRELSSSGSTTAENAYQESLLRAGIDDLLIINDADQKEGSLTVLGLAGAWVGMRSRPNRACGAKTSTIGI